jgi:hypothetical protein
VAGWSFLILEIWLYYGRNWTWQYKVCYGGPDHIASNDRLFSRNQSKSQPKISRQADGLNIGSVVDYLEWGLCGFIAPIKAIFGARDFSKASRLKFKEETGEILHLEHSIVWCWKLNPSESRSNTWKVLKRGAGEDKLIMWRMKKCDKDSKMKGTSYVQ